jgi:hypothetical protein
MTVAFLTPLADAPRQAFQSGFSATFVFYFAPVLKRLARMNASTCGRPSLLLLDDGHPWTSPFGRTYVRPNCIPAFLWPRKKEGLGFFA